MKITAQEEYGLRILVRIARSEKPDGLTIPELSCCEGLTQHYVAKLCRVLRLAGLIKSQRGKTGGYLLSRPAEQIPLNKILEILGGKLFSETYCQSHRGIESTCTNSGDCSLRFLWQILQDSVDDVLEKITLQDLLESRIKLYRRSKSFDLHYS
jgi:Rrf2 family iron-sulfur cluster assembly transcriptional regulator